MQEAQVETEVVGIDRLPREVRRHGIGYRCIAGFAAVVEEVVERAGADRLQVEVVAHLLVAQRTVRQADLTVVPPVADALHEPLFGEAPAGRHRGEVAPAILFGEARRAVGAHRGFEEILALVVVVDAGEEPERLVGRDILLYEPVGVVVDRVERIDLVAAQSELLDDVVHESVFFVVHTRDRLEVVLLVPAVFVGEVGVDVVVGVLVGAFAVSVLLVVGRGLGPCRGGGSC